jgi:hypothetical protein
MGIQWLLVPDRYRTGGPVGWLIVDGLFQFTSGVCLVVMSTFGVADQYDLLLYAIEIVCFPIQTHDDIPFFPTT